MNSYDVFRDRVDAGRKLAERLSKYGSSEVVVLAIPRGGVVVGFEVAKRLEASLSVIVPHKICAPDNPELAIGAVTEDGETILDWDIIESLEVDGSYIEEQRLRAMKEIRRRMKKYLGDGSRPALKSRVVILVDDGVATGATMKAAVGSVRLQDPGELVIAVPVAPPDTVKDLKRSADTLVCLLTPYTFYAVGQFYKDFAQVGDAEVVSLLRRGGG